MHTFTHSHSDGGTQLGGAGDRTSNLPVTGHPALPPPEPHCCPGNHLRLTNHIPSHENVTPYPSPPVKVHLKFTLIVKFQVKLKFTLTGLNPLKTVDLNLRKDCGSTSVTITPRCTAVAHRLPATPPPFLHKQTQSVEIRLLHISHIPGSGCFRPQSPPAPASPPPGAWWS